MQCKQYQILLGQTQSGRYGEVVFKTGSTVNLFTPYNLTHPNPLFHTPALSIIIYKYPCLLFLQMVISEKSYYTSNSYFKHYMVNDQSSLSKVLDWMGYSQGLILEIVEIDGEKSGQIRTVARKIVTHGWPQILSMESKQTIHVYFFYIFFLMFTLSYQYDQKTGIAFTGSFYVNSD